MEKCKENDESENEGDKPRTAVNGHSGQSLRKCARGGSVGSSPVKGTLLL